MIDITLEHPEYEARAAQMKRHQDLYAGGERFLANAREYLPRRYSEPSEVYEERLARAYYENYIGSIVDWYATTLFRREPVLLYEGGSELERAYYNGLTEQCDRRGTGLCDFFRKRLTEALVHGRALVRVDFPRAKQRAKSRAEEDELGLSKAFLQAHSAQELVNWEEGTEQDYEWVVLRTERGTPDLQRPGQQRRLTRWLYLDQTRFQVYEQTEEEEKQKAEPRLTDEGQHGLAPFGRVPLFEMRVPEGLWLMNKAATLQLEHFSKSNALSWALTNGLFAMPVIYSDREFEGDLGEGYYLRLGAQDRFGWSEPEGRIFDLALRNIDRLKDELYRVCYLLHQASGSSSSASALTGLSKQRDFAVTQEILRGYGDLVKDVMKEVLRHIAAARGDSLTVSVSGLDEFDIGDFGAELEEAQKLLSLGVQSPTLRSQIYKKLAMKYLCDARQDVKDQIAREIDVQV